MEDKSDVREEFNRIMETYRKLFTQTKYKEAAELTANALETITMSLERAIKRIEVLQIDRDRAYRKINEFYDKKVGESSSEVAGLTEFSMSELNEATNNFHKSKVIGEGGFGVVYKGFLRHTTVAIKVLTPERSQGDIEFNKEVEILTKVRHPNLVSLIGANHEARALVYEFMPHGSLDTYLNSRSSSHEKLDWKLRVRIASEICSALIFLHSIKPHGIAHGDLKPANILVDSNFVSKISDFGVCCQLHEVQGTLTPKCYTQNPKGNLTYIDPMYLSYGEMTPQADVYAFGIILLQFVTGRDPRGVRKSVEHTVNTKNFFKAIDGSAGKWPVKEAKKMADLGLKCSDMIRSERPNLKTNVWPVIESMKRAAGLE